MAAVDKRVYRNSAIYTFCNFMLKAMNFLLLPIYTVFLTTSDYGITGMMDRFVAVATVLSTFSLQAAVVRFYVDYRKDREGLRRFIGTLICFATASTIVFNVLFVLLRNVLVPTFFAGISFVPTVLITLSGLCFTNIYGIYQQVLRGMEKARDSAITSIAYLSLNIIFTLIFIAGFGLGANGSLLGTALAGVFLSVYATIHLMRLGLFRICIDWKLVRELLAYSIPLMPHNLSTQIAQFFSGVLINAGGSLAAVGLYDVAAKIGGACDTLQSSVSTAYQPWLFRVLEDRPEDYKTQIVGFTSTLLDTYTLVFAALGLFIREPILLLLNKSYAESWMLVPPIVLVYAAKSAYYFYIGVLFYHKEATKTVFMATVTSSILNVLLTFWAVPIWGAYGSVLADGLAMVVRVGIVIRMSLGYEDYGYRVRQFTIPFITVLVVYVIGLTPCYLNPYSIDVFVVAWRLFIFGVLTVWMLRRHPRLIAGIRKRLSQSQ